MTRANLESQSADEIWLSPTEALTRFHSPEIETTTEKNTAETFFGFRVGRLAFFISANTYCEVVEQLHVNRLPNVDAWFSGLLNLRGDLVPVIDLHVLFDEPKNNERRHLLVIDRGEKAMAIWIDGLPEIYNIHSPALKQFPSLPSLLEHCTRRAYLHGEQIWLHVQFESLFQALANF